MRCLRVREAIKKTGLSKSTFYEKVKEGVFPKPIKIGKTSLWIEEEIDTVLRAYAAGMPETQIKRIVKRLEQQRKMFILEEAISQQSSDSSVSTEPVASAL